MILLCYSCSSEEYFDELEEDPFMSTWRCPVCGMINAYKPEPDFDAIAKDQIL